MRCVRRPQICVCMCVCAYAAFNTAYFTFNDAQITSFGAAEHINRKNNKNQLPIFSCSQFLCELAAVFVLVSIANAWLLLPTLAMAAVTYGLRHVYISTARSVKRVESMSE